MDEKLYFKYWGKARKEGEAGAPYHLLPYHCLDVAAVADVWWESCGFLRKSLMSSSQLSEQQTKAWLLFFMALHDYGKLDIRFQLKAPQVLESIYPEFDPDLVDVRSSQYFHGPHGFSLFYYDFEPVFGWLFDDVNWQAWRPWMAAVTGHHGEIPRQSMERHQALLDEQNDADISVIEHDSSARKQWVSMLEQMFLIPAGLSLHDSPPPCNSLLAGYCSVSDWLGSNSDEDAFQFESQQRTLKDYYQQSLIVAKQQLARSGLLSTKHSFGGVQALLPDDPRAMPRQLQVLVGSLPVEQGLTLIEAPTGAGKTETALAFAWRLLAAGLADSIIFALPTQATANAMLKRLETVAPTLFEQNACLVLAHGKSQFNDDYWRIKQNSHPSTAQEREEANVQCAEWLASSRKRAFLGQIGVCTIDQVLISVLPVRHKFVRGFGIGKSVLIVDEVHAYDSYMYGLLGEVLKQQRQMGGSVLLLSATLPYHQRQTLSKTWQGQLSETQEQPYPLVTHINRSGKCVSYTLQDEDMPTPHSVYVDVLEKHGLLADDELIEKMISAAHSGAQVVFICNLVDVAQSVARALRERGNVPVDLFHARYRFCDRQEIEKQVLAKYGKHGERKFGAILIATQVVEQSLDLDFDWMITQLCPVDLLFQRLGRLHRHKRPRPEGFEAPRCTVLIPNDGDYGYHGLIYGNTRVLWRTAQKLLNCGSVIRFPGAYRDWIECVYKAEEWGNEPEAVLESYQKFCDEQDAQYYCAQQLIKSDIEEFRDTDSNVSALTRDGEMSLNVLPVMQDSQTLLDGEKISELDAWWKDEATNLNMVSVPAKSWGRFLPVGEGLTLLPLVKTENGWQGEFKGVTVRYSEMYGLEKEVAI